MNCFFNFIWVCCCCGDYEQLRNNNNNKPEEGSRKALLFKSNSATAVPNRKYYPRAPVNHLTSIINVPPAKPQPSLVKTYIDPPYILKPCVPDNPVTSKLLPPPPSIPKPQPAIDKKLDTPSSVKTKVVFSKSKSSSLDKDVSHPKEASVTPRRSSKATLSVSAFPSSSEIQRGRNRNVPATQPQPSLVTKPNTSCTTTVPVRTYNDLPYILKPCVPASIPKPVAASISKPQPTIDRKLDTPASGKTKVEISKSKNSSLDKDVSHPKEASMIPHRSSKATLSVSAFPSSSENQQGRSRYVMLEENSTYKIPKHMEDLMKKNIVPQVLYEPLSRSTYKDYFATLLYAENFYFEKWNNFLLEDVTLELEDAQIYKRKRMDRNRKEDGTRTRIFVKFEIDSIPEERPFLLSRDFIFAQPLGSSKAELYQGVIYRVVRSNNVLGEFGDDFHYQYEPTRKYNVSFLFNRVCLKRAHEAIESASDSLFKDFIFPDDFSSRKYLFLLFECNFKLDQSQRSAVSAILGLDSAPPYLIEDSGASYDFRSSRLKSVVLESVLQIYQMRNPIYRILICAPANRTLDDLITNLKGKIPESHMFRANAAFRDRIDVPEDILSSCRYKEDKDCFICPPLKELLKFQVIFTTFMSSVRLRDKGISSGHFSLIFLLDASLTTEPEALVPLASFANTNTAVVVTGKYGQSSTCVRSDIGRKKGLKMSYFERLRNTLLYNRKDNNGEFVKVV